MTCANVVFPVPGEGAVQNNRRGPCWSKLIGKPFTVETLGPAVGLVQKLHRKRDADARTAKERLGDAVTQSDVNFYVFVVWRGQDPKSESAMFQLTVRTCII